ncbi:MULTISPECIES: hypothetical protein [unclassified Clostridium]|uniref:hypothetical protein n=1 Tax=unclassified Clostridium TaxID=2614128 RepID=UPI000297A90D|nr:MULTISPECIES: hypothetical protein [unclassified Clostridium]EKQ56042.1 MAG: hypothetical protein A370_02264 [Clostridium sp. Maddingley MBC34-26]
MEDIIREFKDKFEHMVINFHETDNKYYQEHLDELKDMNNYIEKRNMKYNFRDVLIEVEKAILLEHKERCQIISQQFERTKGIVEKLFIETLNDLQNSLKRTNISEFNIICKSEYDLVLAGSFDFAYYHDVEIIFKDVDFILCPGCKFNIDNFRLATSEEIMELDKCMNGWEKEGFVTCLENTYENTKYYIVAQQVQFKRSIVSYKNMEGVQEGQKLSDWAREELEIK